MAVKDNRLVALSEADKRPGRFVTLAELELKPGQGRLVYFKGLSFPILVAKQLAFQQRFRNSRTIDTYKFIKFPIALIMNRMSK